MYSFITSTNNHITRISSLMHKLSYHFGSHVLSLSHPDPSLSDVETMYHLFPTPEQLPTSSLEGILRELGFGYRAGFIDSSLLSLRTTFGDSSGSISDGLMAFRSKPVEEVRDHLIFLKGVGRKVADCVMLMCMDQPSLIPIDVHLGNIAARHPSFPSKWKNKPMSKVLYTEIQDFLVDKWGPMGGWCQAVMFAADLRESSTALKPAMVTPVKKIQKEEKEEEAATPGSPDSTVLITPKTEDMEIKWNIMTAAAEPETPTRSKKTSSGKRKQNDMNGRVEAALPSGYGFKRTRSATRIELLRSVSSEIRVVGKQLDELDVE